MNLSAVLGLLALAAFHCGQPTDLACPYRAVQEAGHRQLELERVVDEIMRTGRLPATIDASTPKETLRELILAVDQETYLKSRQERDFDNGGEALHALLNLHGPLESGAPPGLVHVMLSRWDGTMRGPLERHLPQGAAFDVIAADGPWNATERLNLIPTKFVDTYATDLVGWVGSRVFPGPFSQRRRAISGWDREDDLCRVVAFIGDWGVERCEDFARAEDLPKGSDGTIVGVIHALAGIAARAETTPMLRIEAARSINRIYRALDRATARLGAADSIRAFGFLPSFLTLAALSGAPAGLGMEDESIDAIARALPKITQLSDERMNDRTLAAVISALDASSADLCRFASAPEKHGRPEAPNSKQRRAGLVEASAALTERVSVLPTDHPAWTLDNRVAWASACVRALDEMRDLNCAAMTKAWTQAKSALPANWVTEAESAAETRESTIEERRKARESQRAAWQQEWKDRWHPAAQPTPPPPSPDQ